MVQWVKALQINWKVPGLTLLGARPGLGIQSHYEASGDLQVETWINAVIDIG